MYIVELAFRDQYHELTSVQITSLGIRIGICTVMVCVILVH